MNQVNRGGGWYDIANYCQLAYRDYDSLDYRYDSLGFRIAKHRNRSLVIRGGAWRGNYGRDSGGRDSGGPSWHDCYMGFRLVRRKR